MSRNILTWYVFIAQRFYHTQNFGLHLTDSQAAVKNVFIRGSVVRYVHLPANAVDTALLEDATRREAANAGSVKR